MRGPWIGFACAPLVASMVVAGCGNTYVLGNLPGEPGDASAGFPGFPSLDCDAGEGGGCATRPPFDPCAGIACGGACTPCQSNDPQCGGRIAANFLCDRNGACTETAVTCGDAGAGYVPCPGNACGQTCTLCAPDDTTCFETEVGKVCGGDATCSQCVPH